MKKSLMFCFIVSVLIVSILIPTTKISAQNESVNLNMISVDSSAFPTVQAMFSVSDPQGFPIKDLQPESFTVSEDKKPVSDFSITPINNADSPLAIVLVIDVSGSMTKSLKDSIAAAKEFIGTLGPNDQVALISFNEKPTVVQELTTDRTLLTQGLDNLKALGDSALFDSLIAATGLLKSRTERKAVVVITDGYETGISSYTFDQVINEAYRWSTHFYPIGIGGVNLSNLDKLAQLSGGFTQINPGSAAISDSFENILSNFRNQYLLRFDSELQADGVEHELLISYKYPEGLTSDNHQFIAYPREIQISFSELSDGQEVSGKVFIAPKIVSPGSVQKLEIEVDHEPLTTVQSAPFEYLWDSTLLEVGEHVLSLSVLDSAGNQKTQDLNLVIVPPVIVSSNLTENQPISGKIKINVDVKAARGIVNVILKVDDVDLAEDLQSPYEFEWDTLKTQPGYHDVRIVATDLEQNVGESLTRVNVEIQKNNNLIWMTILTLLIAMGVIIPIARRKNRITKQEKLPIVPTGSNEVGIPSLIEKEGLNPGHIWKLTGSEIRLGRKQDENDIPLKGISASRFHAVIKPVSEGFLIQALHPENPLIINEITVDSIVLKNGDLITAGESKFLFEE